MQTFLPLPSFEESAKVLDRQRLGKQRVEAIQIWTAIARGGGGWYNHPATKMWRDHMAALAAYADAMIKEWMRRGYQNNMPLSGIVVYELPPWFGDDRFHSAHRQTLLFKNPQHYSQFGWKEEPKYEYWWPVT